MDETFIRTTTLPEWLKEKHFKDKDFYSIDELIATIEDQDADIERLEEELEDLRRDREENYRPLTERERIGICLYQ